MMKPLNDYVQIEPEKKDDFIASPDVTYNEVGTVITVAQGVTRLTPGDRVYFDSWMASKFPDGNGGFFWLVPYSNIKAYESPSTEQLPGGIPSQISDTVTASSGFA